MRALFEAMSVGTLTFSQAVTLAELHLHSDGKRPFFIADSTKNT
jgi:hypothetical protein